MQLTTEQKQDLQNLMKHPGFKIVEELVKEKEAELFRQFKTMPLGEESVQRNISQTQNFLAGMESLISTIKGNSQVAVNPDEEE